MIFTSSLAQATLKFNFSFFYGSACRVPREDEDDSQKFFPRGKYLASGKSCSATIEPTRRATWPTI